jgi:predicted Zn-dependent protease
VEVFVAGYSKNQELEADREGAKLAAAALLFAAGLDPTVQRIAAS